MEVPQYLLDAFWATVQAVLVSAAPVVVGWLVVKIVALAADVWSQFKGDNSEAAYKLEQAVELAVAAAEQNGLSGALATFGQDKKTYAIQIAEKYLERIGVKIDLDLIDAAIEAEVLRRFPKKSE